MPYEIEFIGVNDETKDAASVCVRWKNMGSYTVGIYDGGFNVHGEALKEHLNKYYFDNIPKVIDFVILSHPHEDHASGLSVILNEFDVKALYMNRPWEHVDILYDYVNDGRITKESLSKRLRDQYSYVAQLEEIALYKRIPIYDAFEGEQICDRLMVLSPSKQFYLDLLVESSKTPLSENESYSFADVFARYAKKVINYIKETWSEEKLREDVVTEPDNETSIVVFGQMDEENFLLTGDVGIRGLKNADFYANKIGISLAGDTTIYEIPHHGSRHNISSSILNSIVGNILEEGGAINKRALVCTGKGTDHPKQMVVNAYTRRGVKVCNASGSTIRHNRDMPARESWRSVEPIPFKADVEDWN